MKRFPVSGLRLASNASIGLVEAAAELLLDGHFPESMHDAIRERVGLRRETAGGASLVREEPEADDAAVPRRPRDPDFRDAVLRAYERRCAVCDFDLRIADDLFGLEAAHIKWHAAGGPGAEWSRALHPSPQGARPGRHRSGAAIP